MYETCTVPIPVCEITPGCGQGSEFFVPGATGHRRACPEHAAQSVQGVATVAVKHLERGESVTSVHSMLQLASRQMIAQARR